MDPLSIAGHGVFDAVPDGGAVPLLRAAAQRGRETVGGGITSELNQLF